MMKQTKFATCVKLCCIILLPIGLMAVQSRAAEMFTFADDSGNGVTGTLTLNFPIDQTQGAASGSLSVDGAVFDLSGTSWEGAEPAPPPLGSLDFTLFFDGSSQLGSTVGLLNLNGRGFPVDEYQFFLTDPVSSVPIQITGTGQWNEDDTTGTGVSDSAGTFTLLAGSLTGLVLLARRLRPDIC